MPVTFYFTSFVPSKLKKLSTLLYRSLIHVRLVDMDGQLPFRPSNKHLHQVVPFTDSGMAVANESPLPPGASLEGVG